MKAPDGSPRKRIYVIEIRETPAPILIAMVRGRMRNYLGFAGGIEGLAPGFHAREWGLAEEQ